MQGQGSVPTARTVKTPKSIEHGEGLGGIVLYSFKQALTMASLDRVIHAPLPLNTRPLSQNGISD